VSKVGDVKSVKKRIAKPAVLILPGLLFGDDLRIFCDKNPIIFTLIVGVNRCYWLNLNINIDFL